jgi:hypothetical protein
MTTVAANLISGGRPAALVGRLCKPLNCTAIVGQARWSGWQAAWPP